MDIFEKTVEKNLVYEGLIVNVRMDMAEIPNGKIVRREVVEHPGGVCVLPLDPAGNVVAVRQFRYCLGIDLLEAPAGKLEKGEDHRVCGLRELSEETGYVPGKLIYLGFNYPSPGFCDEIIHLYLALDLSHTGAHLDEDEFLNVELIPFERFGEMIMSGEIRDSKTVSAYFMAQRFLRSEGYFGKQ